MFGMIQIKLYNILNVWLIGLSLFVLVSCGGYRELPVDVLVPASSEVAEEDLRIVFVDRKIIHRSDIEDGATLKHLLGLTRDDLVSCFYDGLRDGFQQGAKRVIFERAIGLRTTAIADTAVPALLSPEEVRVIGKNGEATHVLALDYCMFRLDENSQVDLNDNLLLHLYRVVDGKILDTIRGASLEKIFEYDMENDVSLICDFLYQKGLACASILTPTWKPVERRIYTSNRWLRIGYYYLKEKRFDEAYRLWSSLLGMKTVKAAQAAVNIAWLYEQNGNFQGAIVLLETSLRQLGAKYKKRDIYTYIEQYIAWLQQRIRDERIIQNQL